MLSYLNVPIINIISFLVYIKAKNYILKKKVIEIWVVELCFSTSSRLLFSVFYSLILKILQFFHFNDLSVKKKIDKIKINTGKRIIKTSIFVIKKGFID